MSNIMKPWPHQPTIMAIVQFAWFNIGQGTSVKFIRQAYTDPVVWGRYIATSKSGKRLQTVFKDRYHKILWRQANADKKRTDPADPLDYDTDHIMRLIATYDPEFVILFGESASAGFRKHVTTLPFGGQYFEAEHPAKESSMTSLVSSAFALNQHLEKNNLTL